MTESRKRVFEFKINNHFYTKYSDGKIETFYMQKENSYYPIKISQSNYECAIKAFNKISSTIKQSLNNKL